YFLSNQSEKQVSFSPTFRSVAMQPELWDPVTGRTRVLSELSANGSSTTVPLTLEPLQSVFIVFRNPVVANNSGVVNFPEAKLLEEINTPWKVTFDPKMRGPEKPVIFDTLVDWTMRPEESIKYYAGTAVYSNTFRVTKPAKGERIYLNFSEVSVMAKVKVNGTDVGGVWTAPWRVDITDAVVGGVNTLEISVVNNWVNRLIGDSKLPADQRKTWTNNNPYKPDSKLVPSGLTGAVVVKSIKY
ncbi:MAG: glycoside hydrolase family 2, partial [Pedobacter sp.]